MGELHVALRSRVWWRYFLAQVGPQGQGGASEHHFVTLVQVDTWKIMTEDLRKARWEHTRQPSPALLFSV